MKTFFSIKYSADKKLGGAEPRPFHLYRNFTTVDYNTERLSASDRDYILSKSSTDLDLPHGVLLKDLTTICIGALKDLSEYIQLTEDHEGRFTVTALEGFSLHFTKWGNPIESTNISYMGIVAPTHYYLPAIIVRNISGEDVLTIVLRFLYKKTEVYDIIK